MCHVRGSTISRHVRVGWLCQVNYGSLLMAFFICAFQQYIIIFLTYFINVMFFWLQILFEKKIDLAAETKVKANFIQFKTNGQNFVSLIQPLAYLWTLNTQVHNLKLDISSFCCISSLYKIYLLICFLQLPSLHRQYVWTIQQSSLRFGTLQDKNDITAWHLCTTEEPRLPLLSLTSPTQ